MIYNFKNDTLFFNRYLGMTRTIFRFAQKAYGEKIYRGEVIF